MNVVKLDANWLPTALVEDYSSMVWTERFLSNGDFQMNTAKIDETRLLIPEGSFISLLDSKEVMLVETHVVNYDDDGFPYLQTEGRTFETFTENRAATTDAHGEPWSTLKDYKFSEIISYLLWTYLVNATGEDPSRDFELVDAGNAIPDLVITDSSTFADAPIPWSLAEGDIYTQLKNILALSPLGVRGIRPPHTAGDVVSFDTSAGITRGDVSITHVSDISDMRLDVYNGLDRTRNQSDREPVIFHYDSGHIDAPKYLFSVKDYRNLAVVSSSLGNMDIWPETGTTPPSTIPTGLDRRVLYVDGGTQGDADIDAFTASVIQKGMVELAKHNRKILFDGAISTVSPYSYGKEYFLGDFVSLMAQYGFEAEMMVAEYVRTEDIENGDRGYPTLVLAS